MLKRHAVEEVKEMNLADGELIVCAAIQPMSCTEEIFYTNGVRCSVPGMILVPDWGCVVKATKPCGTFLPGDKKSAVRLSELPDGVRKAISSFCTDQQFCINDHRHTPQLDIWMYRDQKGYLLVGHFVYPSGAKKIFPLAAWGPVANQFFEHAPSRWLRLPD